MREIMEGSHAIALAVKAARPNVVSAYPITPQTHIVEDISQLIADGDLDAQYVKVESEHSAMSVCIGASATGARTYTATTSQGLALMHEVLFNAAGMRLPIVMTVANRALSAPLSIWNDHQDSISERDSGWIQIYAEDNTEASDLTIQAYRIAEDTRIQVPVMVCMDGYTLTHTYEPVELLEQDLVDNFLPTYRPTDFLDVNDPKSFGMFADPNYYTEFRYQNHRALEAAKAVIPEISTEFGEVFDRDYGGLIDEYRCDDAEYVLMAMGSVVGTLRDTVDDLRDDGVRAGAIKLRSYRPFPSDELRRALAGVTAVGILDKNISLGFEGALFTDVKASLYHDEAAPNAFGFIAGLGGRDIPKRMFVKMFDRIREDKKIAKSEFFDLRPQILDFQEV
ncbi:MAG TPA: pyruvate synthase subunit PorA [Candidatus Bathyarchaeia archaeon]|nr:pyruvate synthase subunit PorA [Candidatus Bathyarchaeia archaeon]